MPISIETLPDEPVVLVKFSNPMDIRQEIPSFVEALREVFDASPEPLIDITDATGLKVSFGDIVAGMAMLTRGEMAVLRHPHAAAYIVIADSDLIRMAGNALTQGQYGGLNIKVVRTLDEALNLAREMIQARG